MNHPLYDIAISEVRNQATPEEVQRLKADPAAWRACLESAIDEMESQFRYREANFADATEYLDPSDPVFLEQLEAYQKWKKGGRTFLKHVEARLPSVKRLTGPNANDFAEAVRAIYVADMQADELDDDDLRFNDAIEAAYSVLQRFDAQS